MKELQNDHSLLLRYFQSNMINLEIFKKDTNGESKRVDPEIKGEGNEWNLTVQSILFFNVLELPGFDSGEGWDTGRERAGREVGEGWMWNQHKATQE